LLIACEAQLGHHTTEYAFDRDDLKMPAAATDVLRPGFAELRDLYPVIPGVQFRLHDLRVTP
jgi:hypothetical protein